MDNFWQGHSLTTLRGRKQGPVEFFYQHSWTHPPPLAPLHQAQCGFVEIKIFLKTSTSYINSRDT